MVTSKSVIDDDELMLISQNGVVIMTRSSGISVIGRNTLGVRLMILAENDAVTDVAKIAVDDENVIDDVDEIDDSVQK